MANIQDVIIRTLKVPDHSSRMSAFIAPLCASGSSTSVSAPTYIGRRACRKRGGKRGSRTRGADAGVDSARVQIVSWAKQGKTRSGIRQAPARRGVWQTPMATADKGGATGEWYSFTLGGEKIPTVQLQTEIHDEIGHCREEQVLGQSVNQ